VHFAHLGAPVLGDELYGNKNEIINRQALHCKSIEIIHPRSNQRIMFEADIPEDMNCLFSE
jgi:23S rRNA pseudouridine1911/1915/1917 synthase